MQTATVIGAETKQRESIAKHPSKPESDSPPTCCGKPMESRFARAHERLGQTFYVSVWHSPVCKRDAL